MATYSGHGQVQGSAPAAASSTSGATPMRIDISSTHYDNNDGSNKSYGYDTSSKLPSTPTPVTGSVPTPQRSSYSNTPQKSPFSNSASTPAHIQLNGQSQMQSAGSTSAPTPNTAQTNDTAATPSTSTANGNANGSGNATGGVGAVADPVVPLDFSLDIERTRAGLKRKWKHAQLDPVSRQERSGLEKHDEVELAAMDQTATALQLALLQDHISTLYPTRPTPFTSFHDVVEKLVPYHIWQIHDEELAGSGKEQQSVLDAREEKETSTAKDLIRRMTAINDKFLKLRQRDDLSMTHPSFIQVVKESTMSVREELSQVQNKLRIVERQRDQIEQEARRVDAERQRIKAEKTRREVDAKLEAQLAAIRSAKAAEVQREAEQAAQARAKAAAAAAEAGLKYTAPRESKKIERLREAQTIALAKVRDLEGKCGMRELSPEHQKDPSVLRSLQTELRTARGVLAVAVDKYCIAERAEKQQQAESATAGGSETPGTPTSGRGSRGRGRGRGRGGARGGGNLREAVLSATVDPKSVPSPGTTASPTSSSSSPITTDPLTSAPRAAVVAAPLPASPSPSSSTSQATGSVSGSTGAVTGTVGSTSSRSMSKPAVYSPPQTKNNASAGTSTNASAPATIPGRPGSTSTSSAVKLPSASNTPSPAPSPSVSAVPAIGNGSGSNGNAGPPLSASTAGTGTKGTPQGPIMLTVPAKLLTQFVPLGLIAVPPTVYDPAKHPGSVIRTTEDRQSVVMSLQLRSLATLLNVKAAESDAAASPGSSSTTSTATQGTPAGGSSASAPARMTTPALATGSSTTTAARPGVGPTKVGAVPAVAAVPKGVAKNATGKDAAQP